MTNETPANNILREAQTVTTAPDLELEAEIPPVSGFRPPPLPAFQLAETVTDADAKSPVETESHFTQVQDSITSTIGETKPDGEIDALKSPLLVSARKFPIFTYDC